MKINNYNEFLDKVHGCWYGKCLGGAAGAPLEGVKKLIDIKDFTEVFNPDLPNDDLDIQLLWLEMLENKGYNITSCDLADAWIEKCWYPFSEYGYFMKNYMRGIKPPYSGIVNNRFFKEGMGCPIRSEIWGVLCAGKPELAKEYAYLDACLDHADNSVYAEQFLACVEAMAFFESDIVTLAKKGMEYIPSDSKLAAAFNFIWENTKGNITELFFERFASFANDHIYAIKVSITPKNHSESIRVTSGADLRTKSGGFKMCTLTDCNFLDNAICFDLKTKGKYAHEFHIGIVNSFVSEKNFNDGKFLTQEKTFTGSVVIEKKIYISTSRDEDALSARDGVLLLSKNTYDELFSAHKKAWTDFFRKIDIEIDGDDEADIALRFCNYHTAVSIPRNDCVHSLAAKNLTGQGYNDYVWWDCEVYQCPVFIYAGIENVKNMLLYRYNRLDAARHGKRNGA